MVYESDFQNQVTYFEFGKNGNLFSFLGLIKYTVCKVGIFLFLGC